MRLIHLSIRNIASIEEAEIDFAEGVLASEPIFLICGPTGAGKSTILDAICLALYATTPRLENAPNERYDDRAGGFRDTNRDTVGIDDPRMLMRRGTVECSASLTFADDDSRRYVAQWSCSRARRKADGRIQNSDWQLIDADTGTVLCARKNDTAAELRRLIGLDFEQFCRTTMLAQGAFSRFLTSESDEKSRILERLTGTDIYSVISQNIFRRFRDEDEKVAQMQRSIGEITLLGEEAIDEMKAEIARINDSVTVMRGKSKEINAAIESVNRLIKAEKTEREALNAVASVKEACNSEKFVEAARLVTDFDRSGKQREMCSRLAAERQKLNEAQQRASDKSLVVRGLSALIGMERRIDGLEKLITQIDSRNLRRKPYAEVMAQRGLIADRITRLATSRERCDEIRATINRMRDEKTLAAGKLSETLKSIEESENLVRNRQTELDKLLSDSSYSQLNENELNYGKLTDKLNDLRRSQAALELWTLHVRQLNQRLDELSQLSGFIARETAEAETARMKATEAAERADQADNLYDKQLVTVSDFISGLRADLKPGDPCPLCGQLVTEVVADEHFAKILAPIREHRDNLRNESKRLNIAFEKIEGLRKAHVGEAARKRAEVEACRKNVEKSERAVDTSVNLEVLKKTIGQLESEIKTTDTAVKSGRLIRRQAEELTKLIAATGAEIVDARRLEAELSVKVKTADSEIVSLTGQLSRETETIERLTSDISTAVAIEGAPWYEEASRGNYTKTLELIDREIVEEDKDHGSRESAAMQLASCRQSYGLCRSIRDKLVIDPSVSGNTTGFSDKDLDNMVALWQEIQSADAVNRNAIEQCTREIARIDNEIEQACSMPDAVSRPRLVEIISLSHMVESSRHLISDREKELAAAQKSLELAAAEHREALSYFGNKDIPDIVILRGQLAANESAAESALRRGGELGQRLQADSEARTRHAGMLDSIKRQEGIRDMWGRLNELFGSADGKRMRTIAQSYILRQLVSHANHYLAHLSRRYRLKCQPGQLTLLIEDIDAGGEIRPAVNLSGGESFLVSLALALGLPSLSGKAMALDVIFIDEGFGTLDSNTLSTVIETLERLHRIGGRRVGIISHVDSLRERIAARMIVQPVGGGRSTVEIAGL